MNFKSFMRQALVVAVGVAVGAILTPLLSTAFARVRGATG